MGDSMELVRQSIVSEWKDIIKRGLWIFTIPALDIIYFILNNHPGRPVVVETFVDRWIPFNKYFVIPYVCWYGYLVFFIIYFCIIDSTMYFKLLGCVDAGFIISFIIFYFYPTTVPRPIIHGNDILDKLILLIYTRDNPVNCFPSIHVLQALLIEIFVSKEQGFNRFTKSISLVLSILIVFSTMFIKQHYFMDVISATILAYVLYFSACSVEVFKYNTKIDV
jgi:membrane-associated phospholipid phosphatase